MKVFFILSILASALATNILSSDELKELFIKFMKKELSEDENHRLQDAFEILRRPSYFSPKDDLSETRMLMKNHFCVLLLGYLALCNGAGLELTQLLARIPMQVEMSVSGQPSGCLQTACQKTDKTLDCLVCRSAFGALFSGVTSGQIDEETIEAITILCSSLGFQSENVCRGVVLLNLPIFNYIIRNSAEATPEGFCSLALQVAGHSSNCPYDDPRFDWKVELPEPIEIPQVQNRTSKPLTTVIVTDAHIDPYYEPFSVADCGEPTCCRKGQKPRERYTLNSIIDEHTIEKSIIKDDANIALNLEFASTLREARRNTQPIVDSRRNSEPAGYWGDYRDCDTPIWAYDDVIETIGRHQDIDVVYYIGDSIDHHVWERTYDLVNDVNAYIVDKMRKTFGSHVLVVPALGNHETQPTNQFAPSSVTEENLSTAWLYKGLVEKWGSYLTEEAKSTLLERGEFSMLIRPGLRVISLNNNIANRFNWWLVYDPLDAKNHLDWLIEELHKAELAGEKVHILAHIPPGVQDLTHTWTREYNRIVTRFASTIAAEFNGHTHSDEFKIFYSVHDGKPISMAWGGGSATAYSHYNLNYKIATINPGTFEPYNIVNYVYNLTEANLTPNRRPHWFQLYDIRNSFNLPDLSPETMDDLVHRMVTNKRLLLHLYAAFFSKLSDNRWPYCGTYCKLDSLCRTVVTVLWERQKCNELRDLFFR